MEQTKLLLVICGNVEGTKYLMGGGRREEGGGRTTVYSKSVFQVPTVQIDSLFCALIMLSELLNPFVTFNVVV